MGDFNCGTESHELQELVDSTHLQLPTEDLKTFPIWRPNRKFDHILISEALRLKKTNVLVSTLTLITCRFVLRSSCLMGCSWRFDQTVRHKLGKYTYFWSQLMPASNRVIMKQELTTAQKGRIAPGLAGSIYRDGPGFSQLSRNVGTRCRDEKCGCGQFLFLQVEQCLCCVPYQICHGAFSGFGQAAMKGIATSTNRSNGWFCRLVEDSTNPRTRSQWY